MAIDSVTVAAVRTAIADTMADTAVIKRPAYTTSAKGSRTAGTPTTVATVAARLAPAGQTPVEKLVAEQVQAVALWRLSVPVGTDVTAQDTITVGARTFEVVSVLAPKTLELVRRVLAVERT